MNKTNNIDKEIETKTKYQDSPINELNNEKPEHDNELKPEVKPSSKPLLTAPQIEPPKSMMPSFLDNEKNIKLKIIYSWSFPKKII
ncbi:hypothetical protein BCR32DRAFT_287703 [Anaeromyces robustus]|uniref:Uncharacterized protein n=1 Tax=Anaeromyces robustus TaxID=1754192 RepID=A0A1Y1VQG6_9FUNG|nr:hypothetical protein BCR32DRAFT_287703 [Anaeromyces robustus]|eukprot:ORX63520.1 hypothetical protein BCR32DRAFT_287703 [Anaeromyces robustus]